MRPGRKGFYTIELHEMHQIKLLGFVEKKHAILCISEGGVTLYFKKKIRFSL